MAKKHVITAAPTPPLLTLNADEIELIRVYRTIDIRSKQHILGLSKRFAERFSTSQRPALRLVDGGAK